MGKLKSHKDMDVWQIAEELKDRVMQILERPRVKSDFNLCDQLRRSGRSAPANLCEAFWRYRPLDKARYVEFAIASLGETQNHLGEARKRNYIDDQEHAELESLDVRAIRAAKKWHKYLETCSSRPPGDEQKTDNRKTDNRNRKPTTENPDRKPKTQNREPASD